MSLCVLDGDLISFKASAACEKRYIVATHKASGRSKRFDNRTALRDWLKTQDKWEESDFDIQDERDVSPIENCLHTVKMMVQNISAATGCSESKIVVQGSGNFRESLLLPTKYKGGREDMIKPFHLKEAQNYLKGKYKAEIANGVESDDILSMYAYEGYTKKKKIVQCSVDKDARQCMGWLYDWDKMSQPMFVSGLGELYLRPDGKLSGHGRKWLYVQGLVGDNADVYRPTELSGARFGEKTAYKLLKDLDSDRACWSEIQRLYKEWYSSPISYTSWNGVPVEADYLDIMQMYFTCAHMLRYEGDKIDVKSILDKMGIEI